jgi:hypothetical protein
MVDRASELIPLQQTKTNGHHLAYSSHHFMMHPAPEKHAGSRLDNSDRFHWAINYKSYYVILQATTASRWTSHLLPDQ